MSVRRCVPVHRFSCSSPRDWVVAILFHQADRRLSLLADELTSLAATGRIAPNNHGRWRKPDTASMWPFSVRISFWQDTRQVHPCSSRSASCVARSCQKEVRTENLKRGGAIERGAHLVRSSTRD